MIFLIYRKAYVYFGQSLPPKKVYKCENKLMIVKPFYLLGMYKSIILKLTHPSIHSEFKKCL